MSQVTTSYSTSPHCDLHSVMEKHRAQDKQAARNGRKSQAPYTLIIHDISST